MICFPWWRKTRVFAPTKLDKDKLLNFNSEWKAGAKLMLNSVIYSYTNSFIYFHMFFRTWRSWYIFWCVSNISTVVMDPLAELYWTSKLACRIFWNANRKGCSMMGFIINETKRKECVPDFGYLFWILLTK